MRSGDFIASFFLSRPSSNNLICTLMSFTNIYNDVLSPFLKKYNEAENLKLKKAILKNAAESVRKSRGTLEVKEDLPKDLEKVCFFFPLFISFHLSISYFSPLQAIGRYFRASHKKASPSETGDPKPVKYKQVYTIRDVIKQRYRELIEDEIPYK